MSRAESQAGFTLVEMLVALLVFSILSVVTLQALTISVRSKDILDDKMSELERIQISRALMASDMAAIVPQARRDTAGRREPFVLEGGQSIGRDLIFVRSGRINPEGAAPRGDLLLVEYVFEEGVLWRQSQPLTAASINIEPVRQALFEDVETASWEFVADGRRLAAWQAAVVGDTTMPESIWLTLDFENGESLRQGFEVGL